MLKRRYFIATVTGLLSLSLILLALFHFLSSPYEIAAAAAPVDADDERLQLPDLSNYNHRAILDRLPEVTGGDADLVSMADYIEFMPTGGTDLQLAKLQEVPVAKAILLKSGVFSLAHLRREFPEYVRITAGGYLLKIPVFVAPDATLIIKGKPEKLFLSAQSGAYLSSMGRVFILDTEVTGWLPFIQKPAHFQTKDTFRPYLVFWDGSQSFISNSKLSHLGYDLSKAYGLSFSTREILQKRKMKLPRPSAMILNSTVEDLYYGLYTYEADDIAIIGNLFKENIIYGIDPHDRSRRLIIAYNEATGSKKRHGIIISREVNDSWIFKNKTHDNRGSGIMIDRNSRKNIIAYNDSYANGQDGLVFYESPDNLSLGNMLHGNGGQGMTIRNSQKISSRHDRISDNQAYGLKAYTANLDDQETRDTDYDRYEQAVSFDISETIFARNKTGQMSFYNLDRGYFHNLHFLSASGGLIEGDIDANIKELYQMMSRPDQGVIIRKAGK